MHAAVDTCVHLAKEYAPPGLHQPPSPDARFILGSDGPIRRLAPNGDPIKAAAGEHHWRRYEHVEGGQFYVIGGADRDGGASAKR